MMDLFDLTGRVAVVTGGNRGIGLGMVRGLLKAGGSVAIWARDSDRNAAAVSELGSLGPVVGFGCDVSDADSVAGAMRATLDRFDHVDTLFANAAATGGVRFEEMDYDEWRRVFDVNVDGLYHCARIFTDRFIAQGGGGSMVFTASVAAHLGIPTAPHYTASKGAVLQLARALAGRLARYDIRVNVLSPGWVATEMTEDLTSDERFEAFAMARTPLRRWGDPSDFEGPAVFLASSASSFVTGAELIVDGGFSSA